MKYENLTQNQIKEILGYSLNSNANFKRIIERQKKNNVTIIETGKEGYQKLYTLITPEKEQNIVLNDFVFKKEIIGLQELANELHYTYDSIKTNFQIIQERQLKNFDRLIIKEKNLQNQLIFKIYEKPSDKNQDLLNEEWKECIFNNNLLVSNKGRIRNKKDNYTTYGSIDNQGYCVYGAVNNEGQRLRIHREVLKAFNPIENEQDFYVDHINGIRNDNRLENLRWATATQNTKYKDENNTKIQTKIAELIQKYGYEETLKKIENIT